MRRGLMLTAIVLAAGSATLLLRGGEPPSSLLPDAGSSAPAVATRGAVASPPAASRGLAGATDAAVESPPPARAGTQRRALLSGVFDEEWAIPPGVQRWLRSFVTRGQARAFFERDARAAKDNVDRYCEQARRLREHPLFPEGTRVRDAAVYLEPRTDWEDGTSGTLRLPDELAQRMRAPGWATALTGDDLAALDFGWMKDLRQFDHWSLETVGPFSRSTEFFTAPIPNFATLMHWVKLRLASGLLKGDVREAATEVHHLAFLVHTNDLLISEAIAVAMLRFEREAWEVAAAKGVDVSGWQPVDGTSLAEWRRSAIAGASFLSPLVEDDVMRKAWDCVPARCAALVEAKGMTAAMRSVLGKDTGHLDALDTSGCDAALLRKMPNVTAIDPADIGYFYDDETALERWAQADAGR